MSWKLFYCISSGCLQSSSNIKSRVSSGWILQDIKEIVKARLSKLSKKATYHSFTPILKVFQPYLVSFSNTGPLQSHSEFTLLPIDCLPPSVEVSRVAPILTLLPILSLSWKGYSPSRSSKCLPEESRSINSSLSCSESRWWRGSRRRN